MLSDQQLAQALLSLDRAKSRTAQHLKTLSASQYMSDALLGHMAVDIASSFLGVTEDPPGSNDGHWVRPFIPEGRDPGAWCAYFAYRNWERAIDQLNARMSLMGIDKQYELVTRTSGSTARFFQKNMGKPWCFTAQQIRSGETRPQTGDVWIRNANPQAVLDGDRGSHGHAGLTTGYGSGTLWTIEGNTDSRGWDTNGGTVAAKLLREDDDRFVGIVRVVVRLV